MPSISPSPELRMRMLMVVVGCLFAALLARLWFLQVIDAHQAQVAAAENSVVTVYTPAPRGEILDRNGQVLVGNKPIQVIEADRDDATNRAVIEQLSALLGESYTQVLDAIDNNQYTSLQPVPIDLDPTPAQILQIAENKSLYPGVEATTEEVPWATTLGEYASDVVGYVGLPTATDLAALQKKYPAEHYDAQDLVGLTGIEAEYQQYLAGTPGVERLEVDALGDVVGVLSSTPPVQGDNVVLTIDGDDQKVADEAILQGQKAAQARESVTGNGYYKSPGGSVVVEDPTNGQMLALATEPTFDVNKFNEGITEAQYDAYQNNPDDPLENRAISGQYAPGSTFKLVTASAGLKYGIITPTSWYYDTGVIDLNGYLFHDDGGVGAGYIQLPEALTVSSDNYFNEVGIQLWDGESKYGPDALQDVAASYGLGSPTGIDLPGEASGLIPTVATLEQEHKENAENPDYWVTGDSAEMAIGQFQVEVTPLQLANAYSAFANGGTVYRPQLVLKVETPQGRTVVGYTPHVNGHSTPLSSTDREAMIQGYLGVTHDTDGTGYPIFGNSSLGDEDVAGKTGTAQVTGGADQDTSVFVGFAPASSPRYVVDSFMEDSGYGESVAAPIVREVFDQIFHKTLDPVSYVTATGNAT